ncbi:MAG TPA: hypothetical protein VKB38_08490 [Terracidiphilus sp.]|nr:hypothetical protein [Terracidiphilus sp.]
MIPPIRSGSLARPQITASARQFPASSLKGINLNKQTRFDARSKRRRGDWGILGVPTPLLWLEDDVLLAAEEEDLLSGPPPITDLWP